MTQLIWTSTDLNWVFQQTIQKHFILKQQLLYHQAHKYLLEEEINSNLYHQAHKYLPEEETNTLSHIFRDPFIVWL